MTDSERFKLVFGPYTTPLFEYGQEMECALHGTVIVCGLSSSRIPWPIGKKACRGARGRFPILTGDLERAVMQEAGIAVAYWWGVSEFSITNSPS